MSSTTLEPPVRDPIWSVTPVRRLGFEVDALDLFCGFGGSSQGIRRAGITLRAAANHNERSIEVHAANFRDADHWRADLVDRKSGDYVDVRDLPRARFLWASPSCTHHSRANAKKLYEQGRQLAFTDLEDDFDEAAYANSERSRVSMCCVLRYAEHHRPEIIIVENVVEVAHWGPDGDGSMFRWWLRELDLIGYDVQDCWLNSMFFGVPQSRDRVYLVCSLKGNTKPDVDYRPPATCTSDTCQGARVEAVQTWKPRTAAWPLPRWGRYGKKQQYVYTCPTCRARVEPDTRPALDILDLSIPMVTIGERAALGLKVLVPKTRDRIFAGLERQGFVPVITAGAGNVFESTPGNRSRRLDQPLPTQSTTATHALATPPPDAMLFQTAHGGRDRSVYRPYPTVCASDDRLSLIVPLRRNGTARSVSDPLPTVCAGGGHHALVMRNNTARGDQGQMTTSATEPLRTVTTTGHQSILVPYFRTGVARPVYQPATTVTTRDRLALVTPDETLSDAEREAIIDACGFRMLEADPEIRGAMGFEPDYILLGKKGERIRGLGNAVTPPVPEWLAERAAATLRGVGA